ncbi:hypothetical protein E1A91_D13G188100v1, partial [Gossypium mustelinum]
MMILKSFIPGNLISLHMTIINSVVMAGLYYRFLTTLSIGPSYIFLLRARVMEEREERTESYFYTHYTNKRTACPKS